MKKLYCDRCGCETDKLFEKEIPDKPVSHGTYIKKTVELCENCNRYIVTSGQRYDELSVLQRIAFFDLLMLAPHKKVGEAK